MSLEVTIGIIIAALALAVFARWKSKQPVPDGEIRYVPWNGLIFVALITIFAMIGHLISLLTGTPFTGRRGGF